LTGSGFVRGGVPADERPVTRNERDAQKKNGQRVLVLWLCWLALAVFLVAAGVVAFVR